MVIVIHKIDGIDKLMGMSGNYTPGKVNSEAPTLCLSEMTQPKYDGVNNSVMEYYRLSQKCK